MGKNKTKNSREKRSKAILYCICLSLFPVINIWSGRIDLLQAAFESEEHANEYIDEVLNRYLRYRQDQLEILRSMAQNEPNWIEQALEKCRKENLLRMKWAKFPYHKTLKELQAKEQNH